MSNPSNNKQTPNEFSADSPEFANFESDPFGDLSSNSNSDSQNGNFDFSGFENAPEGGGGDQAGAVDDLASMAAIAPAEETAKGKKAKKEKKPKVTLEKKTKPAPSGEKASFGIGDLIPLGICLLIVLAILIVDALIAMKGLSLGAIIFIVVFDIFGILALLVPFLLWKTKKTASAFDVCAGIALTAIVLGSMALIFEWYRYQIDYTEEIKNKGLQTSISSPSIDFSQPF